MRPRNAARSPTSGYRLRSTDGSGVRSRSPAHACRRNSARPAGGRLHTNRSGIRVHRIDTILGGLRRCPAAAHAKAHGHRCSLKETGSDCRAHKGVRSCSRDSRPKSVVTPANARPLSQYGGSWSVKTRLMTPRRSPTKTGLPPAERRTSPGPSLVWRSISPPLKSRTASGQMLDQKW